VRAFQRQQGLDDDGIAGNATLQALGLDPDTPQPVPAGDTATDSNIEVVTVNKNEDPDIVGDRVNAETQDRRIHEFAQKVVDTRRSLLESTSRALDNFQVTMSFASAAEANPDVLGGLVSTALLGALDVLVAVPEVAVVPELVAMVAVIKVIKASYDEVTTELEKESKAEQSHEVGGWIKDQRAVIDGHLENLDVDDVVPEIEKLYLSLDPAEGQTLQQKFGEVSKRVLDRTHVLDILECIFYEQWINAHFKDTTDDDEGCIEINYEYFDNTFDFSSCKVKAPLGDKLEDGFNRLFKRGYVPGIGKPIDLRVRKRVGFYVDAIAGGKAWYNGWVDTDNSLIYAPDWGDANKAWQRPDWHLTPTFERN
jgi:hypothetical protein